MWLCNVKFSSRSQSSHCIFGWFCKYLITIPYLQLSTYIPYFIYTYISYVITPHQDIGGREIRVKLCSNNFKSKKSFTTSLSPSSPFRKDLIFESPHKAYIGNLDWSITVESLKEHFTKFGSVVSARLLRDKKFKKKRVYGFVSFASADQLKAAAASSGTV